MFIKHTFTALCFTLFFSFIYSFIRSPYMPFTQNHPPSPVPPGLWPLLPHNSVYSLPLWLSGAVIWSKCAYINVKGLMGENEPWESVNTFLCAGPGESVTVIRESVRNAIKPYGSQTKCNWNEGLMCWQTWGWIKNASFNGLCGCLRVFKWGCMRVFLIRIYVCKTMLRAASGMYLFIFSNFVFLILMCIVLIFQNKNIWHNTTWNLWKGILLICAYTVASC